MPLTGKVIAQSIRYNLRSPEAELEADALLDMLNQAIDWSQSDALYLPVYYESLVQADDTYEYALTGGDLALMHYIYDIYLESEVTGLFNTRPIPKSYYTIEPSSTPYLFFNRAIWTPLNAKPFRIVGAKPQARISDLDDTVYLPPAYIIQKATALGHSLLAANASAQRAQWHAQQQTLAEQRCELTRTTAIQFKLQPNHLRIPGRV
jgi:hypothetical protein